MVVTQFGTVELDPMRVPTGAAMDRGRKDDFATRLDEVSRNAAPAEPQAEPERDEVPAPAATERAEPEDDAVASESDAEPAHPNDQAPTDAATPVVVADPTNPSRGEPARRIEADEVAGSPLESRPARTATAADLGALAPAGDPKAGTSAFAAGLGQAGALAKTTAGAATPNVDRVAGAAAPAAARAAAAKVGFTGYRTMTRQAVQLDEQARDSVFKQILFKLGKDGGEMRIRLEPPELGELDLHMLVENGNTLRLSIGTDRQDLRDLLQSGLGSLQQALAARGLDVAHAEVHSRRQGSEQRTDRDGAARRDGGNDDDGADGALTTPVSGTGWYSAQGLDYWA